MKKLLLFTALFGLTTIKAQTLQWAKSMGGSSSSGDNGNGICVDATGNAITTGSFAGTADFDPGASSYTLTATGGKDIFISKLDAAGNFVWAKSIVGTSNSDEGFAISVDVTGNIYTTGHYQGTADFDPNAGTYTLGATGSNSDMFVLKLDAAGNFVWAVSIGNSGTEQGLSIKNDAAGNVYISGVFENSVDFDPGAGTYSLTSAGLDDSFVLKLDAAGNFVWARQLGGTASETARALAVDAGNNVYIAGNFNGVTDFDPGAATFTLSTSAVNDAFVTKLDPSGNFLWAGKIGGPNNQYIYSLTNDPAGNIIGAGYYNSGSTDFDPGVTTYTVSTAGLFDAMVFKWDPNGAFIWADRFGGTNNDYGYTVHTNALGEIYVGGSFLSTADFDPGVGTYTFTSAGASDLFIAKVGANGNFLDAIRIGGTSNEVCNSIAGNSTGNIYATGNYAGFNVDFDPDATTFTMTSAGNTDVFVIKLSGLATDISEANSSIVELKVFPNPSDGSFTIQSKDNLDSGVEIINMLGETVYRGKLSSIDNELSLNLPAGIYTFKISESKRISTAKIIIQK